MHSVSDAQALKFKPINRFYTLASDFCKVNLQKDCGNDAPFYALIVVIGC